MPKGRNATQKIAWRAPAFHPETTSAPTGGLAGLGQAQKSALLNGTMQAVAPKFSGGSAQPPGTDQTYGSLKNDATSYYLSHGGTQANVDAYTAAHPNQDYNQLFNDAQGWYMQQPGYAGGVGDYYGSHNTDPNGRNKGDMLSSAAAPPPPTSAPPARTAPNLGGGGSYTGGYPASWINTYNQQTPGTQAAMRDRFSGKSPAEISVDWNANIAPAYMPGSTPGQILGGLAGLARGRQG